MTTLRQAAEEIIAWLQGDKAIRNRVEAFWAGKNPAEELVPDRF